MKKLILLLAALPLCAANHYVRASAAGTGTGADWTNACTDFSGSCAVTSLVRGDTYYIAGGSYASRTFSKAASTTLVITIQKATISDHGTATGWSDTYASSTATFSGGIVFTTAYWLINGVTGGGPGSWTSGFGIAVTQTSGDPIVEVDSGANFVTMSHVSITGNSNSTGGGAIAQDGFAIKGGTNFKASYFYTNAIGRCPFFCGGVDNACPAMIVEYGYIGTYVSVSAAHSEVLSDAAMAGDIDFRYSIITHIEGTGGIMWDNSGSHTAQLRVYGNVFYRDPADNSWDNNANGLIGGWTGGGGEDCYNIRAYNNTFVNITGTIIFTNFITRFGNNDASNNLFYNSISADYSDFATHDYNYYITSGGAHSEAHAQTSPTTNPFIDTTSLNFGLVADTTAGETLSSPFDIDPNGNSRTGVWDRGAFEYFVVPSSGTIHFTSGAVKLTGAAKL